ncbi:MAG: hypothetical protein PHU93_01135 [Candidatus Gracilibacteria bacterium]|nr:hypothetical protein [Candidatus Gracilibacteria bacterium]
MTALAVTTAIATTVGQAHAAAVVLSDGTITLPQADVDLLGQQAVNGTVSLLTIAMQFGKWIVVILAIYGVIKFAKSFIKGR